MLSSFQQLSPEEDLLEDTSNEDIAFAVEVLDETSPLLRPKKLTELAELIGVAPDIIEAAWRDSKDIREERKSGAHANYDTKIKIRWREEIKKFLEENTSPADRKNMKVICLPSKFPIREVQIYLDLGFDPGNIHAVEGDRSVWPEFKENCESLGIKAICGRLEDVLPQLYSEGHKYSVVSYDFLGPMCIPYLDIIGKTPVEKECVLILNVRAAREQKQTQQRIRDAYYEKFESDYWSRMANVERALTQVENLLGMNLPPIKVPDIEEEFSKIKLPEIRDDVYDNIACATLGTQHEKTIDISDICKFVDDNIPNGRDNRFKANLFCKLLAFIGKGAFDPIHELLKDKKYLDEDNFLADFVHDFFTHRKYIGKLKKTRYISQVSSLGAPYNSLFLKIEPGVDLSGFKNSIMFLVRALSCRIDGHITDLDKSLDRFDEGFSVGFTKDKSNNFIHYFKSMNGIYITAKYRGKVVGRVKLAEFLADYGRYHEMRKAYRLRASEAFDITERELLRV